MAEIPVKKKPGGFNWLWLLLVAVIVALLIGWFVNKDDNNAEPAQVSQNITLLDAKINQQLAS